MLAPALPLGHVSIEHFSLLKVLGRGSFGKVMLVKKLDDGTPYIAVTPQLVGPEQVKDVVAAGDASAEEICTGDVAEKCEEYGVE